MIKKILLGALAVVVLLVVVVMGLAAAQPDTFEVARSATINAPAETIYGEIADLRRWMGWSPWEGIDPAMQRTYSGAESGTGAVYAWQGNSDVGSGQMEITEASAPNKIAIRLSFEEPFESEAMSDFLLEPDGGATKVTWSMHGANNFVAKVICLFVSMDDMIGGQYEKGLASLKTIAEK